MIAKTSQQSYIEILNSGYIGQKQQQVLECIINKNVVSDMDISYLTGLEINCVTPRRGELEKLGLIENIGTATNLITKKQNKIYRYIKSSTKRKLLNAKNRIAKFKKNKKICRVCGK